MTDRDAMAAGTPAVPAAFCPTRRGALTARLRRLSAWLSADRDEMWQDASFDERWAEDMRRELTGRRPLR
jgi:hypothetical protein